MRKKIDYRSLEEMQWDAEWDRICRSVRKQLEIKKALEEIENAEDDNG